jgi:hypothetical protein
LTFCQLARTAHAASWMHKPGCVLHSVIPIGPSTAAITSASVIRSGGRGSR